LSGFRGGGFTPHFFLVVCQRSRHFVTVCFFTTVCFTVVTRSLPATVTAGSVVVVTATDVETTGTVCCTVVVS
jgi:hypothetical protein